MSLIFVAEGIMCIVDSLPCFMARKNFSHQVIAESRDLKTASCFFAASNNSLFRIQNHFYLWSFGKRGKVAD